MTAKITSPLLLILFLVFGLFSCQKDEKNDITNTTLLEQYTPEQSHWTTFSDKPFVGNVNTAHDPDGVGWITPEQWENAKWDGTIYNPSEMTQEEFYKAIFPYPDVVRGLREVFYQHNPFKDIRNPTKAEVDEWHRIAINHVRALVGYTASERQVQKDHCLFARALWSNQRMYTTMWDEAYPGNVGTAEGPCQNTTNAHCGASFIPNATDQAPYLPENFEACSLVAGAEGISSAPKSNIPWSIKWVRALGQFVGSEGFWGGHVGPWFHREKFGFSFWDADLDNNNSNAILRAKWSGNLLPNLYEKPTKTSTN